MTPRLLRSAAALTLVAALAPACGSRPTTPSPPPPAGPDARPPAEPPAQVGCTEEAKICPDGSAVGRVGPSCDFAPCPEDPSASTPSHPVIAPPVVCTKDAKICPDGSTVGRVGPDCAFAPCPGEPRGGCKDLCGNGTCEEVVCLAIGCPCAETPATCPRDCR